MTKEQKNSGNEKSDLVKKAEEMIERHDEAFRKLGDFEENNLEEIEIEIDDDVYHTIENLAEKTDTSINKVIRAAIHCYCEELSDE